MARDVETIQADIQRARDGLAAAVDQLADKANPQRLVDQGKAQVQATLNKPAVKYSLIGAGALIVLLLLRKLLK